MKNGLVLDVYVYIYTQIYYMYVYIIKYLVVLYIYIYIHIYNIYIYMVTPLPDPPPKNLICQLFAKKKSLTMHLIWRISPHNASDLQSIFSTSAEPNRRIAELFLG